MIKVYLSGPITNMSYGDAVNWREWAKSMLHPDITTFSPMRGCEYLRGETQIPATQVQHQQIVMATNQGIMMRDKTDCITADALLVFFPENSPPSIGTAMEVAWAEHLHKPIVGVAPEGNINRIHAMLSEAILWVPTLEEACNVINSILIGDT